MRLLGDVQSPYHECVVRFRLRKAEARLIGISMVTGLWRSGFWLAGKLVSGVGVVVTAATFWLAGKLVSGAGVVERAVVTAATFDVDRHWLVCCV